MNNNYVFESLINMDKEGDVLATLKRHLVDTVSKQTGIDLKPFIADKAYTDPKLDYEEMGKLVAFALSHEKLKELFDEDPEKMAGIAFKTINECIETVMGIMDEYNNGLINFAVTLVSCLGHKVQTVEIKAPIKDESNG